MEKTPFETITYDDLIFAKITPALAFDMESLQGMDGVIIEYTGREAVLACINTIRSHDEEAIYLLPVFLSKFHRESNQDIARFADGIIKNQSDLSAIAEIVREIKERL